MRFIGIILSIIFIEGIVMGLIGIILSSIFISSSIFCFIEWGIDKVKISNKDKKQMQQTVYKIEKGDLVGDIKGDNIIVILMNGDINGDVNSKDGDVVLIKGDINGDVKANKVICPQQESEHEDDKLIKNDDSFKQPPPDYVRCGNCVYIYSDGFYKCAKYSGYLVKPDDYRMCDYFKEKEHPMYQKCYHCYHSYVSKGNGWYCGKDKTSFWINDIRGCESYDETSNTIPYKNDCIRYRNDTNYCSFYSVKGCLVPDCQHKIRRGEI